MKKTAEELRSVPFPKCAHKCGVVELLGVGECESICPYKFDRDGEPVESWSEEMEDDAWAFSSEEELGILSLLNGDLSVAMTSGGDI